MLAAYINGVRYKCTRNFSISEQAGNKTSSEITVVVEDQAIPRAGDTIELKDDITGDRLFYGLCGIPRSPKYSTGWEKREYKITCGNANAILANRVINVAYQNYTVSQIVSALYTDYIAAEGFSLGSISTIPIEVEVYTAKDMNLQDALNELADLVGAVWVVDTEKAFHFVASEDFPAFPRTINGNFLLGTDLEHTTKDYKTRTVQIISGATEMTSTQSESYTYDGEQSAFLTVFPVAAKPLIYVNGAQVSEARVGVSGLDDDDPDIVFLFAYNSNVIKYESGSDYMSSGATVRFDYVGLFPIRISVRNEDKISEIAGRTGTSGLRERVEIAPNIASVADATTMAKSLLAQFAESTGEIRLWLLAEQLYFAGYDLTDTELLTKLTFYLPDWDIDGEYVIVERTLSAYFPDLDTDAEKKLRVDLRLVNRDYIKSYGEVLSTMRRNISKLSIREEDTVINTAAIAETAILGESLSFGNPIDYYPTAASVEGSLFAPLDFGLDVFPA